MLGVDADATRDEIRAAYRARARVVHPDHGERPDGREMAEVNEAYRVLSDPGRRALYDRGASGSAVGSGRPSAPPPEATGSGVERSRDTFLSPGGPARFPWKSMLVAGLVGSIIVVVSATMTGSSAEDPPDGILEPGSCVTILANTDVQEVQCEGRDDRVVESLVPLDGQCPAGTEAHRGRLGLGIACLDPEPRSGES